MEKSVVLVDPKEYGLEEKKASSIEKSFLPKQIELDAFLEQYSSVITKELNAETFKEARELRLKLVKVRTGIADVHKTEKAFYLASGKYVDALKNKLTTPIEQMEEKLKDIEDYEKRIETERKAALKADRIKAFEPYGTDVSFMPLDEMTEEQFQGQLTIAKTAFEAEQKRIKKEEEDRIEAEKKAELDRIEREKAEAEERKLIAEENEKLKKEAEAREAELKKERESLAKEQAKKDAEAKADAERLAKIAADEKAKSDKLAAEIKAKQDAEKAAIEAEEKRKRDLANAGDQAVFKDFYNTFKTVEFPELNNKEVTEAIREEMKRLCKFMVEQAKKLV